MLGKNCAGTTELVGTTLVVKVTGAAAEGVARMYSVVYSSTNSTTVSVTQSVTQSVWIQRFS